MIAQISQHVIFSYYSRTCQDICFYIVCIVLSRIVQWYSFGSIEYGTALY